jgi:hypothetical protein
MTKYFDAFVYFANWGTHELRFRLPKAGLDVSLAKRYCPSEHASLRLAGEHALLTLWSEREEDDWEGDEGWMSSLAPLRADLMAGDLRCLYLGWLNCVGCDEVEEEEAEPPVPPGLRELTAPLRALADFLRIDETLIEVAAEVSPPLAAERNSAEELRSWIQALPGADKDSLLYRLAQESPMAVQREIRRRFREARRPQAPLPEAGGRPRRRPEKKPGEKSRLRRPGRPISTDWPSGRPRFGNRLRPSFRPVSPRDTTKPPNSFETFATWPTAKARPPRPVPAYRLFETHTPTSPACSGGWTRLCPSREGECSIPYGTGHTGQPMSAQR